MNLNGVYIGSEKNIKNILKKDNIEVTSMLDRLNKYKSKSAEQSINEKVNQNVSFNSSVNDEVEALNIGDMPAYKHSLMKLNNKFMITYPHNDPDNVILCNVIGIGEVEKK